MYRLITLFTFFLTGSVFAQQNKIDIGFEGSAPSFIFLRGNNVIKTNDRPTAGFSGGFFFQYNFPKLFSLRTAVDFERKGALVSKTITDNNGFTIGEGAFPNRFDYLTVPILFRATWGGKVKYFAEAGPYFGYLIKQTIDYKNSGIMMPSTPPSDNTGLYKRFDMGIKAGMGILIPIKKKYDLSLELCDSYGLLNVNKVQMNVEPTKMNSISFLMGVTYKIM